MDTSSKLKVQTGFHPRGQLVSIAEVTQCLLDLTEWFKTNAKEVFEQMNASKCTDDDIKKFNLDSEIKLPAELVQLYQVSNGAFQFHDNYQSLSLQQILEHNNQNGVSSYWKKNYFTLAYDEIGSSFIICEVSDDQTVRVITWSNDEGVGEQLDQTFGNYIESLRDQALKQKLEYVKDLGLVEASS